MVPDRTEVSILGGGRALGKWGGTTLGARADFAFTPTLFGAVSGQWNNEDEEVILNFRLNWSPRPGSDLFLVINQADGLLKRAFSAAGRASSGVAWREEAGQEA